MVTSYGTHYSPIAVVRSFVVWKNLCIAETQLAKDIADALLLLSNARKNFVLMPHFFGMVNGHS